MQTSDFNYHLPAKLIAQFPLLRRDSCRLLVLNKSSGKLSHHTFSELPELLNAGDRLVFNDTRGLIPLLSYI